MKKHIFILFISLFFGFLFLFGSAWQQDHTKIEIMLYRGTPFEQKGREQLLRFLERYDLKPWIFTQKVIIQSWVIPHSHPILTLNTKYLYNDIRQLSTFIHEQIHWFANSKQKAVNEAIKECRQLYPEVPVGGKEGARSEYSSYLHLIICWLELDAMVHLVGEELARRTLAEKEYYVWIYKRVLEEGDVIKAVLKKHNLIIKPSGKT